MPYDEKCEELARYFLDDEEEVTEEEVEALAQNIQVAVEDFIEDRVLED